MAIQRPPQAPTGFFEMLKDRKDRDLDTPRDPAFISEGRLNSAPVQVGEIVLSETIVIHEN